MTDTTYKKKLIEVAIPLDDINKASYIEKSIRHGHPSTLHLWWARRPLSTTRAVLFASIIDDPSNYLEPKEAKKKRKELFKIIRELVQWNKFNDKNLLKKVQEELKISNQNNLYVLDPFAGGGTIPLAAQSLGLNPLAGDLNPIAVLITKSLITLPAVVKDYPCVSQPAKSKISLDSSHCAGLVQDLRHYAEIIKKQSFSEIGNYYPKAKNGETVVAYICSRTVKCPNPACGKDTPLIKSKIISKKHQKGIEIVINKENFSFKIMALNNMKDLVGTVSRTGAKCVHCSSHILLNHIRDQGKKGLMGSKLMTVITEGKKGKNYLDSNQIDHVEIKDSLITWKPEFNLPNNKRDFKTPNYGLLKFSDLFTKRQLLCLNTFASKISEIKTSIKKDADFFYSTNPIYKKFDSETYANIVITYLAFAFDKILDYNSTICTWHNGREGIAHTFGKQALPMTWDFAEINPFSNSSGNWTSATEWIIKVLENLPLEPKGDVKNYDAAAILNTCDKQPIVSTDPPYYDNISYADLSDFFYVWLRRILGNIYPDLFSTLLVPKEPEIVAMAYRFNNEKSKADKHFTSRLEETFKLIKASANVNYPLTVYYAFKQQESSSDEQGPIHIASTGWETMLNSLIHSGYMITGTWPMNTEYANRPIGLKTNALASSIVLVCRPRSDSAHISTRRDFINSLKKELPSALNNLQESGIAPVDLAQSTIGPGMAVFSRYSKVLEADGNPMSVRTALQIINQELDTYFTEQESDMDKETRFCIAWYEQFGWNEAPFGDANKFASAKGTAVNALEQAGVIYAKAGKVRLLKRTELDINWDPTTDKKLTVWECVQYLIKALEDKGEVGAAEILKKIGGLSESVKELAYRLYALSEKKGWTEDGLAYNALISSWQSVTDKAQFGADASEKTKKNLKDKSQKTLHDI
ncbi:MAG: DUF1156 domain-containing protein [Nanoarchaeota archaeon]